MIASKPFDWKPVSAIADLEKAPSPKKGESLEAVLDRILEPKRKAILEAREEVRAECEKTLPSELSRFPNNVSKVALSGKYRPDLDLGGVFTPEAARRWIGERKRRTSAIKSRGAEEIGPKVVEYLEIRGRILGELLDQARQAEDDFLSAFGLEGQTAVSKAVERLTAANQSHLETLGDQSNRQSPAAILDRVIELALRKS